MCAYNLKGIEIPEGMYEEIKKLVDRKLFRNVADFFYVAGHEKLFSIKSLEKE